MPSLARGPLFLSFLLASSLSLAEAPVPAENAIDEEAMKAAIARAEGGAADDASPDDAPSASGPAGEADASATGPAPKHGRIDLPNHLAQVDVPDTFFYLSPQDTEKVLVGWGNPPGNETLGMLVPAKTGVSGADGWAVVITYAGDGHVADDDAAEIDYDALLVDMQKDTEDGNDARRDAGYEPIQLVGWAEPPRYDNASHKFYWAKRLRFEGGEGDTLNYAVRVLGREGVLELNAVAPMDQFRRVRDEMPTVIRMASFVPGQRYEDFNESTDHMAAYGLAALVAGGVAAKVGLWAKLLAMLIAFKKFLVLGVIALGAWIRQLFKGKGGTSA